MVDKEKKSLVSSTHHHHIQKKKKKNLRVSVWLLFFKDELI